jgi:hypothetical protein
VRLTRGDSAETATLTGLSGNVIFTLEPRDPLPIELAPDQATADVAVRVSATRCDAHAFAESKKTFVFGAWIVVDGVERRIEYAATGDAKAALQELFNRCGENSDSDGIGGQ